MDKRQKREYQSVVLGALLHDVGKFYQRSLGRSSGDHAYIGEKCFEEHFRETLAHILEPEDLDRIQQAIGDHHNPHAFVEYIQVADGLSSGMERIPLEDEEKGDPFSEHLKSIFEEISLCSKAIEKGYGYYLRPLSLERETIFPERLESKNLAPEYERLWNGFIRDFKEIPKVNLSTFLKVFYYALWKYTWCIPSAVYKSEPDISLFDHLKTTAAIAGCLYHTKGIRNEFEFLLVGGDISGIQNFIYKITRAQNVGGISKRLRGRSFYLLLLQDLLTDHIIQKVGLSIPHKLFVGGGRFEILLPNTDEVKETLKAESDEINRWLFNAYSGELGVVIETVEAKREDLKDYSAILMKLDEKLSIAKKRKFIGLFNEGIWVGKDTERSPRICRCCNITEIDDDSTPCKLCNDHKDIGERLPKTDYLVYTMHKEIGVKGSKMIPFGEFGTVFLVNEKDFREDFIKWEKVIDVQKINVLDNPKTGFRFIGNTAPVALEEIKVGRGIEEDEVIKEGDVLTFEAIAESSIGDKRLGILKMDVDHLGLIFSIGLEGEEEKRRKSISRVSSLSRSIDLFFAGYLNKICDKVFEEWRSSSTWEYKDAVTQIFYIVYSGGDDLLIIGPWSEIPKLAKMIHGEFKAYTTNNPDIELSAGVFLCKAKYPVSLGAKGSDGELGRSKDSGRKRITIFGETVEWVDNERLGFGTLYDFGEDLYSALVAKASTNRLPRGFVYGLLRKHRQYNEGQDPNFIPAVIYQLARNIKDDKLRNELKGKLIGDKRLFFKHIKIPASYALLKSRKEG